MASVINQMHRLPGETDAVYINRLQSIVKDQAASRGKITIKTSEKGGVSVYGLGRWPTTLYKSQWLSLNKAMPDVLKYIESHPELAEKGE